MQPLFCRATRCTTAVPVKPGKMWVDKGREFAGEFASFCQNAAIDLYLTNSDTMSAFAERNIRSLKSIIFKYLRGTSTDVYVDNLQSFVNVINSRVNRITKMARKQVQKSDKSFLVFLRRSTAVQKPTFKYGQHVRIRRTVSSWLPHSIHRRNI